jgi:hypothetical protein
MSQDPEVMDMLERFWTLTMAEGEADRLRKNKSLVTRLSELVDPKSVDEHAYGELENRVAKALGISQEDRQDRIKVIEQYDPDARHERSVYGFRTQMLSILRKSKKIIRDGWASLFALCDINGDGELELSEWLSAARDPNVLGLKSEVRHMIVCSCAALQ